MWAMVLTVLSRRERAPVWWLRNIAAFRSCMSLMCCCASSCTSSCFSLCFPVSVWSSATRQQNQKFKKGWWGDGGVLLGVYYSEWVCVTGRCLAVTVCHYSSFSLLYFYLVLFVSTSPWHFHTFFCIWINIYCLDCCWTTLWYQNDGKWTKKTPSVLKILYCHRF